MLGKTENDNSAIRGPRPMLERAAHDFGADSRGVALRDRKCDETFFLFGHRLLSPSPGGPARRSISTFHLDGQSITLAPRILS